jgi:hypothetical protein
MFLPYKVAIERARRLTIGSKLLNLKLDDAAQSQNCAPEARTQQYAGNRSPAQDNYTSQALLRTPPAHRRAKQQRALQYGYGCAAWAWFDFFTYPR